MATALLLTCLISPGPAAAADASDPWSMYMRGAATAVKAGDFTTASILLRRALVAAEREPGDGERTALTLLPLAIAYLELDREDVAMPLVERFNAYRMPPQSDAALKAFVPTLDGFGWAFYNLWQATDGNPKADPKQKQKQATRLQGAQLCFLLEAELRRRLMPEDKPMLAQVVASRALVLGKQDNPDLANKELAAARDILQQVQKRRLRLAAVTRAVAAAQQEGSQQDVHGFANLTGTQLTIAFLELRALLFTAEKSYASNNREQFEISMTRAEERYRELQAALRELEAEWPYNLTSATLSRYGGWLYADRYRAVRNDPAQARPALDAARSAYQRALVILDRCCRTDSARIAVGNDYADLLRAAGELTEAEKISKQYGAPPR